MLLSLSIQGIGLYLHSAPMNPITSWSMELDYFHPLQVKHRYTACT